MALPPLLFARRILFHKVGWLSPRSWSGGRLPCYYRRKQDRLEQTERRSIHACNFRITRCRKDVVMQGRDVGGASPLLAPVCLAPGARRRRGELAGTESRSGRGYCAGDSSPYCRASTTGGGGRTSSDCIPQRLCDDHRAPLLCRSAATGLPLAAGGLNKRHSRGIWQRSARADESA